MTAKHMQVTKVFEKAGLDNQTSAKRWFGLDEFQFGF